MGRLEGPAVDIDGFDKWIVAAGARMILVSSRWFGRGCDCGDVEATNRWSGMERFALAGCD